MALHVVGVKVVSPVLATASVSVKNASVKIVTQVPVVNNTCVLQEVKQRPCAAGSVCVTSGPGRANVSTLILVLLARMRSALEIALRTAHVIVMVTVSAMLGSLGKIVHPRIVLMTVTGTGAVCFRLEMVDLGLQLLPSVCATPAGVLTQQIRNPIPALQGYVTQGMWERTVNKECVSITVILKRVMGSVTVIPLPVLAKKDGAVFLVNSKHAPTYVTIMELAMMECVTVKMIGQGKNVKLPPRNAPIVVVAMGLVSMVSATVTMVGPEKIAINPPIAIEEKPSLPPTRVLCVSQDVVQMVNA